MNSDLKNDAPQPWTVHEIESLNDPAYDDWLDNFQQSFPLREQVLVSLLNKSLRDETTRPRTEVFLVSRDAQGKTTGSVRFDVREDLKTAYIWYLAVNGALRGSGIGSWLYDQIVARVSKDGRCRALILEVESPDECQTEEEKSFAERRIAFYRRRGAKLIHGIRYIQSVEWQPPMPMGLMAHLLQPITAADTVDLAEKVLEVDIERIGELSMD